MMQEKKRLIRWIGPMAAGTILSASLVIWVAFKSLENVGLKFSPARALIIFISSLFVFSLLQWMGRRRFKVGCMWPYLAWLVFAVISSFWFVEEEADYFLFLEPNVSGANVLRNSYFLLLLLVE